MSALCSDLHLRAKLFLNSKGLRSQDPIVLGMKISNKELAAAYKTLRTSCCDSETLFDERTDQFLCMGCWKPRFWVDGTPVTEEELEEQETA